MTIKCAECKRQMKGFMAYPPSSSNPDICEACAYSWEQKLVDAKIDAERAAERAAEIAAEEGAVGLARSIPVTTGFTTAAGPIIEEIDVITSECVFGINIFKDMLGGIRDIVGGRAGAHQKVLKDLRKTCLDELRMNAVEIGADAVIGVDLDYSEISGKNGGLLMLVASGTAVKLGTRTE